MKEKRITIADGDQIPGDWGKPRTAVRSTTVTIRQPDGRETFTVDGGTLTAEPGLDLVISQQSGEEYPIKKEIFAATYEEAEPGRYRKKSVSRLVQVPVGTVAVLDTKEGRIEVRHPDYVVIGAENEVYANSANWVAENLTFL